MFLHQILNHWLFCLQVNGKFPDRIIIYRDGVGDGAMKLIRDYEIAQIESVFRVIAPDYNPKFTFIVVQKRINTRIFLRVSIILYARMWSHN